MKWAWLFLLLLVACAPKKPVQQNKATLRLYIDPKLCPAKQDWHATSCHPIKGTADSYLCDHIVVTGGCMEVVKDK